MTDELKQILRDNNICGFKGETISQLIRELKADNLQLRAELMLERRKRESLEAELKWR